MIKQWLAIISLVMIALLSVAGCRSPTTNTGTSPSPSSSAPLDSQLAQYMEVFNQTFKESHPTNFTAYRVMWNNSTAVQIQDAFTYHPPNSNTTNMTYNETATIIKFSSVDDASKYVNSHTSGYRLTSATYHQNGSYQRVTGHAPTVYAAYDTGTGVAGPSRYDAGSELAESGRYIHQLDEYVWVGEYQNVNTS